MDFRRALKESLRELVECPLNPSWEARHRDNLKSL